MLFDYLSAARRAGIPPEKLDQLCALFQTEFPADDMMAELHILRAILSGERGDVALKDILRQQAAR